MRTLDEDVVLSRAAEEVANKEFAIHRFLESRPELNFEANRNIIRSYLNGHPATAENIELAIRSLGSDLAVKPQGLIDAQAADEAERQRQQEEQEREELLEEIIQDYSRDKFSQDIQKTKLKYATTPALREKVQTIHDRKRFRAMPPDELKQYLRTARGK
jgi:hypothetical protein